MSQYVPDSTITFYQVEGLDTKAGRTLIFVNAAQREAFMATKAVPGMTETNVQVVKKRFQTIRVNMSKVMAGAYDILQYCNYISFINPSYGNKIYYCNIVNYDYINNNTMEISYVIDWWLTDMFVANIESCSILREGFTNAEYTSLVKNPYLDNIKMRTEEPLACNDETEPLRKRVANANAMSSTLRTYNNYLDGWEVFKQKDAVYNNGSQYEWDGNAIDTSDADETPFYVVSFVSSASNSQSSTITLKANVWSDLHEYESDNTAPFLFVTDEPFTISGGEDFTHYARARHYQGQVNVSYSQNPLHETVMPRTYCMAGCQNLSVIFEIIQTFEQLDAVSAILSVQAFPTYLLDEFVVGAFDHPSSDLITTGSTYLKVPFPNVYRTKKGMGNNVHPKLYRFPFAYASLDGVNDSGHIELQFEKIGSFDPIADFGQDAPQYAGGPRLDANGKPTYFVLQKYVSIMADGIYIGVCPVDYDRRLDGIFGSSFYTKTDLSHGVFYTEFPQVPYTTDAYYEFLAQQAKQQILANTAQQRLGEENQYGELAAKSFGSNPILSGINALAGGFGVMAGFTEPSSASSAEAALATTNASRSAAGAGLSTGLGIFNSGMSSSMNNVAIGNRMAEMEYQTRLRAGAENYLQNPQEPNIISENWSRAKNAFVAPNYHAGSCGGILNLLRSTEGIGVNFNIHMRSEDFLQKYSQFMNLYGMATKEFKKPAITKFLENMPSDNAAPKFYSSGAGLGPCPIDKVFYTQTENAHVSNVCSESSQYIENLLNGGAQFIDAGGHA